MMKLKLQKTDLSRVVKALDGCKAQYARASVDAKDNETGNVIPTEVVLCSLVFHRTTGAYMFSGPTVNMTLPPGPNHNESKA